MPGPSPTPTGNYYDSIFILITGLLTIVSSAQSGNSTDGGEAGRLHPELHPRERSPAGRWGPQLYPPPDSWAVQGLPDQIAWRPDYQRVLLRAAGEPGEAVAWCELWHVWWRGVIFDPLIYLSLACPSLSLCFWLSGLWALREFRAHLCDWAGQKTLHYHISSSEASRVFGEFHLLSLFFTFPFSLHLVAISFTLLCLSLFSIDDSCKNLILEQSKISEAGWFFQTKAAETTMIPATSGTAFYS